jgi:hypothetical protein
MNFYGTIVGPQHTFVGRIAPMWEAMRLAVNRAANQPLPPTRYVHTFPQWGQNVTHELTKTVFKGLVQMAPKNNNPGVENAAKTGQMIGLFIRGAIYFWKDVPAQIKRDGLDNLPPEKKQKLENMIGWDLLSPEASELAGRPITNKAEILKFYRRRIMHFVIQQIRRSLQITIYILHRPLGEISAFLSGIPKGFNAFLRTDGEFAKTGKRTEIFFLLLMFWPEIEEMRQSKPEKTRKYLLEWLEKEVDKQLFEDPKIFYELCGDIDLDLAPPGHPSAAVSG